MNKNQENITEFPAFPAVTALVNTSKVEILGSCDRASWT